MNEQELFHNICKLYVEGKSEKEVSQLMEVDLITVIEVLKSFKIKKRVEYTPELVESIIQFYMSGTETVGSTALEFKVDRKTINKILQDNNIGKKNIEKTKQEQLMYTPSSKRIDQHGYVVIVVPPEEKAVCGLAINQWQISEHRYVMSKHLGRPLEKGENVHHKNGVRADNRLENLELWSKSQPPGQRVSDKLKWAYEIIEQYKDYKPTNK